MLLLILKLNKAYSLFYNRLLNSRQKFVTASDEFIEI